MSIYRGYGILAAMRIFRRLALLAGAVCVIPLLPLIAETVRERSSIHFSAVRWSTDPSSVPAVASQAIEAAGGAEAFPALTPLGNSGLPAVYPEIDGLGPLDYSGIDGELLALLDAVSADFRKRNVSADRCDPARPFIPVLTNYRLERLQDPEQVYFSRPSARSDQQGEPGSASEQIQFESVFSLSCRGPDGLMPVLIGVTLVKSAQAWRIGDITIDGGTYAAATRKD